MDEALRATLEEELEELHRECDIDGYGDEGEGYDYRKYFDLLIEAGWTPPEPSGN